MSNPSNKISIPSLENYTGCKGGNGVFQQIISLIPPHKVLVVPFLGHCGIIRNITPADILICGDASEKVVQAWKSYLVRSHIYNCKDEGSHFELIKTKASKVDLPETIILYNDDALHFLPNILPGIIHRFGYTPDQTVIYQDPPYPFFTRKGSRDLYAVEMNDKQHKELLSINQKMMANIIISTYDNKLYGEYLKDWNTHSFPVATRSGGAIETVYYNYNLDDGKLHDYRYLGQNFKDRERIRLKKSRWVKNLHKLEPRERMAIINEIIKTK